MDLEIVAAVAENRVIGDSGGMPWHHPEDLERFRELTSGHPVVMGRRTYESILERKGSHLEGRVNIVLTSSPGSWKPPVIGVSRVEDALDEARAACTALKTNTAYVIGGASVYEQLLPECSAMHITEVPGEPDGDTRFPDVDCGDWSEAARTESAGLSFVRYERS